ncbi:MAG TPA: hypothetical protein VFZ21_05360 [Gemmatimonadaceae bacterium]|jgi:hypothetical protein|nr:hypothetical protein [Gemmatimonadaceae bacterium]
MSHITRSSTLVRRVVVVGSATALTAAAGAAYVAPQISGLTITSYAVPLHGAAAGSVTIDQASAGVVVVSLSSSNTRVVGVPAGIPVQPRATTATFVATGAGPGCAKVTAALGGRTRVRHVVVHPVSTATTLTLNIPNQILPLGGTIASSVKLGPSALVSASLSSSNPAIASVPATVALTRGSGSFGISARAEGCATITATAGGQTIRKTVQVVYIGG